MIFAIWMGILSAVVVLVVMWRIGIDKFMGYPAFMDAFVTVLLAWLLHGSYVGMVAAIIGGLTFSAIITVLRKTRGYSRLTLRGWKHVKPTWRNNIETKGIPCLNLKSFGPLPLFIGLFFVLLCVASI